MGLVWHLERLLAERGPDALVALPFELPRDAVPCDLTLDQLALVCSALGCQPGELLSFVAESPQEQASRALAQDAFYQSFLAYREGLEPD